MNAFSDRQLIEAALAGGKNAYIPLQQVSRWRGTAHRQRRSLRRLQYRKCRLLADDLR